MCVCVKILNLLDNRILGKQFHDLKIVSNRLTVQLISSLTRLDLTKKENMLPFECSKTCKAGNQPYSDTSPLGEFSPRQILESRTLPLLRKEKYNCMADLLCKVMFILSYFANVDLTTD